MLGLTHALMGEKGFQELMQRIEYGGCPAVYSGLSPIHKSHAAAALRRESGRPVVIICPDELEAERMRGDLETLCQEEVYTLYGREFTFFQADSVSRSGEQTRLRTLLALLRSRAGVTVTTPDGLMQRTRPPDTLEEACAVVRQGSQDGPEKLVEDLLRCGYHRYDAVEGPGQFARRGGILDFFSPAYPLPVRCEFFGDELDSMGYFDPDTQRRTENLQEAVLLPAAEALPALAQGGEGGLASRLEELLKSVGLPEAYGEKLSSLPEGAFEERIKERREASVNYLKEMISHAAAL